MVIDLTLASTGGTLVSLGTLVSSGTLVSLGTLASSGGTLVSLGTLMGLPRIVTHAHKSLRPRPSVARRACHGSGQVPTKTAELVTERGNPNVYMEHSTKQQQNTHLFQVPMGQSPGCSTC